MPYTKTTWVDGENKYDIKTQNDVVLNSDIKFVYKGASGTPVSATNMNKIEQGIYDAHEPTYAAEQTVTKEITTLPSTAVKGTLDATLAGNTQTPYDQYTKLLMYFEGADTSTTFKDQTGKTVAASGNAQIDTAQYKYGTSSALFDGTGDYLTVTDANNDLDIGTQDFCIEMWVRLNAVGSTKYFIDFRQSASADLAPALQINSSNILVYKAGSSDAITGTTALTTGIWYHVAIVKNNGVTKLYLNGGQQGLNYIDSNNYISIADIKIGALYDGASGTFNGWIDDLRISVGTPRYTSNFTPLPHSVLSTDRTRIKSVGKNLFDGNNPFLGVPSGLYKPTGVTFANETITVVASGDANNVFSYKNRVYKAGTTIYLRFSRSTSNISVRLTKVSDDTTVQTFSPDTTTAYTPTEDVYLDFNYGSTPAAGSVATITNMMVAYTTFTAYEPYTETTSIAPVELKRISSTIKDTFDANNGRHTKNVSDWVTLSGNAYTWSFGADYTGFKRITATSVLDVNYDSANGIGIKYNGKLLTQYVASWPNADIFKYGSADKGVNLTVTDTDSGWDEAWVSGTSFTGLTWANLIKAYMNGWKLTTANTNVASCVWTGIASGTTQSGSNGYNHVIANIDSGFQPYRMIYQLATPTITNYLPHALAAEPSGTVYVEPYISDVGVYGSNIAIDNASYPIAFLDYVNKIDVATGALTPIPLSSCTVAAGGLTFTISGATAGQYYDYGYTYKDKATVASLTYTYATNLKAQVNNNTNEIVQLDKKVDTVINNTESNLITVNTKIERYGASSTGNDSYAVTNTYPTRAYYTGMIQQFKADVSNTGAATINVDGLGAKTIKKVITSGKTDTITGDIIANGFYSVIYDGTDFVLINPNDLLNTTLSTTGDLVYASGNNTPARLAVGADGMVLVSDGTKPVYAYPFVFKFQAGDTVLLTSSTERSAAQGGLGYEKKFKLIAGGKFRIKFEAKSSSGALIRVDVRNSANNALISSQIDIYDTNYTQFSVDTTTALGDEDTLKVVLNGVSATAYYKNVTVNGIPSLTKNSVEQD